MLLSHIVYYETTEYLDENIDGVLAFPQASQHNLLLHQDGNHSKDYKIPEYSVPLDLELPLRSTSYSRKDVPSTNLALGRTQIDYITAGLGIHVIGCISSAQALCLVPVPATESRFWKECRSAAPSTL